MYDDQLDTVGTSSTAVLEDCVSKCLDKKNDDKTINGLYMSRDRSSCFCQKNYHGGLGLKSSHDYDSCKLSTADAGEITNITS